MIIHMNKQERIMAAISGRRMVGQKPKVERSWSKRRKMAAYSRSSMKYED